ncbi:aspartyl-tRNA synthetase, cytoplasmic [Aspergillus clavatus NRRL 1]|uniref:Aspartate--tRNA ligase, cytoplasmic n=1 Tax=Aspergillus clavatus (strain ATCC 1007 / CBS 513.65 / DSM 816 / NCTC 3887 / NRRL 1 / QM 1276 / 107) TaxID=344612 RepID=A1CS28_ASPCL|nr:aspartyl-tRNA synthetase, cytoplasmic [Aspergillus clavatus NRRL 1]EAW08449.1 aspartyl-tRNA synthetase, cytoplasmic [Aspergillus clavatus NRRL 1]
MSIKRALSKIKPKSDEDSTSSGGGGSTNRISISSIASPRRSIFSGFLRDRDDVSSSDDISDDSSNAGSMSKNQQKRLAREQRRRERSRLSEEHHLDDSERRQKEEEIAVAASQETAEMKLRYGELPLMQSSTRLREPRVRLENISAANVGQEVLFTTRLHIVRRMSSKLVFLIFRQQLTTFQGVLHEVPGAKSIAMIQWAEHLRLGSIVHVRGIVQAPEVPVLGCSIHDVELRIEQIHLVVHREEPVPFSVYEAEIRTAEEERVEGRRSHISDRTRLNNRLLDLRTPTAQSIFRIQSALSNIFRSSLDEQGFIEIHTPKLQGSATESGASVFQVNYFGRDAFLAQSPQLAKQMCIAADFGRVYEIGAVFRAENSNTHRHLTEYTGLDLEMAIEEHYHEMLEVLDAVIKNILTVVYGRYRKEVEIVKHQFPSEDVVWLEQTPIIRFADGIKMLNDSGWRDEDGNPLPDDEDLHTRDEIRLGELVKEQYGTDYYILDKFPTGARPFYAMPDPEDPRFTNSFDIFIRGQEIVSGGQRIHDPHMLEENMLRWGINPELMDDYMEGFRWGAPPHAGAGVGLERLLMLLLKLGNIRLASLFPRDPKSFPAKPPVLQLRHPESSTVEPPWVREKEGQRAKDESQLQPLEHLIANYGDATSTSWGDERFKIWRDMATGAAVSYVPSTNNYAVIPGNPLCDPAQYNRVITQFLHWMRRETKYKPIWLLCSPEVETILGEKLGWRSLSCIAEERVDPSRNQAASDGEIARKIRRAQNEGIKVVEMKYGEMVPDDAREKIEARIQDWLANRKGAQVHLSEIHPWRDPEHRWYFYAVDKSGTICAFVALAMLSPQHGMQVKYSLDFPGSPNGVIEYLLTHAIQTAAASGVKSLTFGAGATATLTPGHNMHGTKIKMLQHTYETLAKQFHLVRKSEFRAKLGAHDEPLYIAYPPHGLGSKGIRAVLHFFED